MSRRTGFRFSRRGTALATVAVTARLLIGFAAIAVDMGVFYNTRVEAQRSADAAALAGAWQLFGDERIMGTTGMTTLMTRARASAANWPARTTCSRRTRSWTQHGQPPPVATSSSATCSVRRTAAKSSPRAAT